VREVREKVAAAFGGKEILIGEVGWPSEGRMRDAALPSPANQARVLTDVVAAAKQGGWKVNLIEAFDQPWKRLLEGTVGGYWGLYDDARRESKFRFGEPVSNQPRWPIAAGLGVGSAFLAFLSFWLGRRDSGTHAVRWQSELAATLLALGSGLFFGWAAFVLPMDSIVAADRVRNVLMFVLALVVPMASSYALARGQRLAGFGEVLDPSRWRRSDLVGVIPAALFIATVIAAIHVALGLVFDPRYKDFPLDSLTGPAIALFILALTNGRTPPDPGQAELAAATVLAGSALFVTANEGGANWQAVWFALLLVLLALTALRARAVPG
jgi:hypothetical protein